MGIFDRFRKKESQSSWRLDSHRAWYEHLPDDLQLNYDILEEFGHVKVRGLDKILADKEAPAAVHYFFYRILKVEELIEPLKKCRFCNNDTEIFIFEKVHHDLIVCCHDHRYDAYATISDTTYEDAKMGYDLLIRSMTKKYSDKSENS